jgi:threonylcarbamoyladenosine tRNA methylthiotransferase MtaB
MGYMSEGAEKKFRIVTLGCRTNQYESQAYHDQLIGMGYTPAQESEQADVCIVNTCTVTQSADSSSRHEIRRLVRQDNPAKLVVTGCSAERRPDLYEKMEGVTNVVPNKDKENLLSSVFPDEEIPEFSIRQFDAHTRAFLKVQDGCNSFCTYCIIPYVRGRSRSRSIAEVLREAQGLIANGYKEIVLTGINIGDFDGNPAEGQRPDTLADLVRAIDVLPGLERLRVSSIDPDEVDDNLTDAILQGKNTCRSMHVVLQSGSNVILKRMNRKYTRQIFFETVEKLRAASPDFTFTTDVIVGFPGETDRDFQDTLDVIREVQFAKVHMFPYSERPRTRAAQYPNKIPPDTIMVRKREVLKVAEEASFALRERFIGHRMKVLTEQEDTTTGQVFGHTDNFLPVWIPGISLPSNELVEVDLLENSPAGLIGRIVGQCSKKVCCR